MVTNTNPLTAEHPSPLQHELQPAAQAGHVVTLSDEWKAWRWIGLRGAGFPVQHVLRLSAPECAGSANRLLDLEARVIEAREKALAALRGLARRSGSSSAANKAFRRLKKGRQQKVTAELAPVHGELTDLAAAGQELAAARDHYGKSCSAAWQRISETIHQIAQLPEFREALIWQNRAVLHQCVASLARAQNTKSPGELRRQQELVARYLQRYCTKNDTIGFFGPVGWAEFDPGASIIVKVKPGPSLLKQRKTYFEAWCIDQVAACFSRHEELLPWATVRRMPFVCLEATGARREPALAQLDETEIKILTNLVEPTPAGTFVKDVLGRQLSSLCREEQIYAILKKLLGSGLITWEFGGPLEIAPEQRLRLQIAAIGDQNLRRRAVSVLDELETLRWKIENSAGDTEELDLAFRNLEERFTQLTQAPGVRSQGRIYAARSLVYEDCIRDIGVDFGKPFLQALAAPLELLLVSARWFTHEMAKEYRKAFAEIYSRLVDETGSPVVNAALFYFRTQALFFGGRARIPQDIQRRVRLAWKQILSASTDCRRVNYSVEELRPKVEKIFGAARPGWRSARHHSPDLMICATSAEAIRRGDYELVLGELHIAGNTLGASAFLHQHPSPDELLLAYERDLPDSRVVPVSSKNWPGVTARTNPVLVSCKDFLLETGRDPSGASASQTLAIAEMWITEMNGQLVVQTTDHRRRFDIIEFFSGLLTGAAIGKFSLTNDEPHTPRTTIDKLVVCRESWCFPVDEMDFAQYGDAADQFLGAQDLRRRHGMPRFVFVKAPPEAKPFYVDFNSPIFVAMFAKFVRRTQETAPVGRITISEMLPAPHEAWLPDVQGRRFTCELRIVAVDSRT